MADAHIYNHSDIQRYLQHKMTPQEMHDFEKAIMNDPFLADALDGFLSADADISDKHLSEIESELNPQKEETKVVAMPVKKTAWWKVAAAAIVLIAVGGLVYILNVKPNAEYDIAQQSAQGKAAEIIRNADSIKPAETPLARVEILRETKKYSQPATAFLSKKSKEKSLAATNAAVQETPDSQSVAMADRNEEVSAIVNKNADAATALRAPAAANASRIMAKSAPAIDTISNRENDSLRKPILKDNEAEAEPEGGWKNFENYILRETNNFKANISNYDKQEIELTFSIDDSGRPDNIKAPQLANKILAQKAIEILKNGPKWTSRNKDKTIKLVIPF